MVKRRRQRREEDGESDGGDDGGDDSGSSAGGEPSDSDPDSGERDIPDASANDAVDEPLERIEEKKKKKVRRLKLSATEDFNSKLRRRGVVYLSRVPPRMGPARVKALLSDFGAVTRIYLAEEDKTARKRRKKAGGSGSKRYTEGWIEFERKTDAKLVGESLNMTRITNHKGSIHHDDLWNVKYLRGFRWAHLTEKVAYERRVREQKLKVEMMEAKREAANYVAQVEAGKRLDYIDERRKKRGATSHSGDNGAQAGDAGATMEGKRRKVRQKRAYRADGERSTKSAILKSLV